jgi:hypothetical protein
MMFARQGLPCVNARLGCLLPLALVPPLPIVLAVLRSLGETAGLRELFLQRGFHPSEFCLQKLKPVKKRNIQLPMPSRVSCREYHLCDREILWNSRNIN